MLSLQKDDTNKEDSAAKTDAVRLDLSSFDSTLLVDALVAFLIYIGNKDAINMTKVMRNFTSYGEFGVFKDKVYDLLHLHPEYDEAMSVLTVEIQKRHKVLILIDLGGTVFHRTD